MLIFSKSMIKSIKTTTPTRICDLGGWTDTWFSPKGILLNIAVEPGVDVCVTEVQSDNEKIHVQLKNFNTDYVFNLSQNKHPLIDEVIRHFHPYTIKNFSIKIESIIPPGASMGTSASVMIGLINALNEISETPFYGDIPLLAHTIESERLKKQTGIQDHIIAYYGGIQFIEIESYPAYKTSSVSISIKTKEFLQTQLVTIYIGAPHNSSTIHQMVIQKMEHNEKFNSQFLSQLRLCARKGFESLLADDLIGFGETMIENTNIQRKMHPKLVSETCESLIQSLGKLSLGWKVNGAGGDGGSISFLVKAGYLNEFIKLFNENKQNTPAIILFQHILS